MCPPFVIPCLAPALVQQLEPAWGRRRTLHPLQAPCPAPRGPDPYARKKPAAGGVPKRPGRGAPAHGHVSGASFLAPPTTLLTVVMPISPRYFCLPYFCPPFLGYTSQRCQERPVWFPPRSFARSSPVFYPHPPPQLPFPCFRGPPVEKKPRGPGDPGPLGPFATVPPRRGPSGKTPSRQSVALPDTESACLCCRPSAVAQPHRHRFRVFPPCHPRPGRPRKSRRHRKEQRIPSP